MFEVHIGRLREWADRLDDTGTALAQPPGLVAGPSGWATAATLSTWESALVTLLHAVGEQTVHTGGSVRSCAVNYRSADDRLRA
jgi:hypothetical protein